MNLGLGLVFSRLPIGGPDLSLDFFAPDVQVDQKIVVYKTTDSKELIET